MSDGIMLIVAWASVAVVFIGAAVWASTHD